MKKTILIVDDFKNTRFATRFTLEREGFQIFEAADGLEALSLFDGRTIDLVVTDLNMPNMDGIKLCEEIRKLEAYKYIPIILLTTETNPTRKDDARIAGVTGWIQKPFVMDKFIAFIKKALK